MKVIEIKNLNLRLTLIRYMQLFGVLSLFLSVFGMLVLFMEWKRPLEDMQAGQEKMLMALAKKPDVFVVKVTGEQTETMTHIYGFEIIKGGKWVMEGASLVDFYNFYKRWLNYATNKV